MSAKHVAARLFPSSPPPSLKTFAAICSQDATTRDYPLASAIKSRIPIYDLAPYASTTADQRAAIQDEWYRVLFKGPGVFVTKNLYRDTALLNGANSVYQRIIESEKGVTSGDHFASGNNDRIWNSFSKHALADPASFVSYYSNPWLAAISSSWLGPGYRITAQVNNVKPGASAQVSHRDYHLGFQSIERCLQFPRAVQVASQFLTLQGAVAHTDMPEQTGPTRVLPFSQTFEEGYVAYRHPEFDEYFLENHAALPLEKGDGIFFSPALFHAAGENKSPDTNRMANLLQVSSAFGKPMESVDTLPLVEKCWDSMLDLHKRQGLSDEVASLVAAVGNGYPFPTNLDNNAPAQGNMSPTSEQDLLLAALEQRQGSGQVLGALRALADASKA